MTPRAIAPMSSPDSLECTGARIDEQLRARDGLVVDLAHIPGKCSDQIQVLSALQPRAEHQRLAGERGATHDVGPACGRLEIRSAFDA